MGRNKKNRKLYRFKCNNCKKKAKSISHELVSDEEYYYEIYCACDKCQFEQIIKVYKNLPKSETTSMEGFRSKSPPPPIPHETPAPKTTPK